MKRLIGPALAAVFVMSGCVSVRIPSKSNATLTENTVLNVRDCAWDVSGIYPDELRTQAMEEFKSTMDHMARINMEKPDPAGLNIAAVKIESCPRGGVGSAVFPSFMSTVILPLMFIRNHYNAQVSVTYALADQNGRIIHERQLRETIKGSYAGWSFFRLAFRGSAVAHVSRAVPALAAAMMIEDIRLQDWQPEKTEPKEKPSARPTENAAAKPVNSNAPATP